MLDAGVRGLAALVFVSGFVSALVLVAGVACGESKDDPNALGTGSGIRDREATARALHAYATDAALRRRALETSLVRSDNTYAQLRLTSYQDTSGWGVLPELNPPTTPILPGDIDPAAPSANAEWTKIDVDGLGWSSADLHKLGERAFFNYPVQVAAPIPTSLKRPNRSGIWEHEGRLGAVWANLAGGITTALTCASCHATVDDGGVLIAGRNNSLIEAGLMMAGDGDRGPPWGFGKVDVTGGDTTDDPVAITDLRPIRWQANLHHAATLRNDPIALAVRIETLIITSHNLSIRPPRKIAAALTAFLLDLAPANRALPPPDSPGAAVFEKECASCHNGEGRVGAPVALAIVATDPLVGQSVERGTGSYRVPSLRFVGDRHRLFASGAIEGIEDLLTPSEERSKKGHTYGLSLSPTDRGLLLEYLRAL